MPAAKVIVPEFAIVELLPDVAANVKLSKGLLFVTVTVPSDSAVVIPVPPAIVAVPPLAIELDPESPAKSKE